MNTCNHTARRALCDECFGKLDARAEAAEKARHEWEMNWAESQKRVRELEAEKYIPGSFECPKCKFFCVSSTLHMNTGTIGPNNKPQECSNGCGPMWKVSRKQQADALMERLEKESERVRYLTVVLGGLVKWKNYKAIYGADESYRNIKPVLWKNAFDAVGIEQVPTDKSDA